MSGGNEKMRKAAPFPNHTKKTISKTKNVTLEQWYTDGIMVWYYKIIHRSISSHRIFI